MGLFRAICAGMPVPKQNAENLITRSAQDAEFNGLNMCC
jgi:hypothetical protein